MRNKRGHLRLIMKYGLLRILWGPQYKLGVRETKTERDSPDPPMRATCSHSVPLVTWNAVSHRREKALGEIRFLYHLVDTSETPLENLFTGDHLLSVDTDRL